MRKIQVLGIALVAMFAFSAIVASMASAETTLLIEWLVSGVAVTANTPTEGTGEILLEDTAFKIGVVCSGVLDGNVGTNGKDEITKVLNLAGEETGAALTGLALICKAETGCETAFSPEVWPLITATTPWKSNLFGAEAANAPLDAIFGGGYEVLCLVLKVEVSENCTAANTAGGVKNVAGGVELEEAVLLPEANCTTGGTEVGANEALKGNLLKTATGTLEAN